MGEGGEGDRETDRDGIERATGSRTASVRLRQGWAQHALHPHCTASFVKQPAGVLHCPARTHSGVLPSSFSASTVPPLSIKMVAHSACPSADASCSGVHPISVVAFTLALNESSNSTMSYLNPREIINVMVIRHPCVCAHGGATGMAGGTSRSAKERCNCKKLWAWKRL